MKKIIFKLFILFAFFSFVTPLVFAYSEKVDVFVPSTGREVKHSSLAQKMENATAKATGRKSSVNSSGYSNNNRNNYYNNSYQNSYNSGNYNTTTYDFRNGSSRQQNRNNTNDKNTNTNRNVRKSEWT